MSCCKPGRNHLSTVTSRCRRRHKISCGHASYINCALANNHVDCAASCIQKASHAITWSAVEAAVERNDVAMLSFTLEHLARDPKFDMNTQAIEEPDVPTLTRVIMYGSIETIELFMKHGARFDNVRYLVSPTYQIFQWPFECWTPQRVENLKYVLNIIGPGLRSNRELCKSILSDWLNGDEDITIEARVCFLNLMIHHVGISLDENGSHIAFECFNGHRSLFKRLIELDLPLATYRNDDGETLLHRASYNSPKTWPVLVDMGADVDAQSDNNSTPLHLCVENDNIEFAMFLIGHGADSSIRNAYGRTPFEEYCFQNEFDSIDDVLVSKKPKHRLGQILYGGGLATKAAK